MDPRNETHVDAARAGVERELVRGRLSSTEMMLHRSGRPGYHRVRQRSMWYLLGTIIVFITILYFL